VGTPGDVSIIITCFNHARFLDEAIQSALSQTHPPNALAVVDDGSTDDTAAVAARFTSVDYIYQNNGGLAAARNAGLRRISTKYVLFLDADDILRPTAIENCLVAFSSNKEAAFVYGGFWLVDSERRFIAEKVSQPKTDNFGALLAINHIQMHGTVMYRADILQHAGGFDESLPCCEDYDVYLRLAKTHPIVPYHAVAAEYRQHGGNMTRNAALMLKTVREVLARQASAAQASSDWRAAFAEGERFWSSYYGGEIVQMVAAECRGRRRLTVLASLIATGLRYDPDFTKRLGRRVLRKLASPFEKIDRRPLDRPH
jgi:glycosyltransferase involved in cell wall biosynthesis